MQSDLEQNIKNSFSKVKNHINLIEHEIKLQKEVLIKQNEAINTLNILLNKLLSKLENLEKEINIEKKTENEQINSLNKQINTKQTHNEEFLNEPQIWPINGFKDVSIGNEGVKQINKHVKHINTEGNQTDLAFNTLKNGLENVFKLLSKQELKVFLTIYQLEEEGKRANYRAIAEIMELSAKCIRTHIHNLIKKEAPISKDKLNDNSILLSIKKEFKALNLKKKLINLYYEKDPYQTTLFDIN